MLTADLVRVRRRGDRLLVVPLSESDRARARELATTALALIKAHLGLSRGALLEAWTQVPVASSEVRLGRGLWKLALDACEFDEGGELDPVALRKDIFLRAASLRQTHGFDRATLLREVADSRQASCDAIEQALYADLPSAHILRRADLPSPDGLVAAYDLSQHQAVLLRATSLRARVFCADPAGYRHLFRKLKFHRLLYSIAKLDRASGYGIDIDGPYSLFEQTTKYGLQLALVLPAIMACADWDITADLRWGKDRCPLRYHARGRDQPPQAEASTKPALPGFHVDHELAALLAELGRLDSPWRATAADAILDVPGLGVCVPDLQFLHRETGQRVFLELLGFWSRAAVWKRVEMVERGLAEPIVFAISKRLRVSEEVLPDEVPASLCVYGRALGATAVLEKVSEVASRARR